MTRSNTDLWITIGFSIIIIGMMSWFVYDERITMNLGMIIPILSAICGYLIKQSIEQMHARSLEDKKK